jgi:phage minor structural protein
MRGKNLSVFDYSGNKLCDLYDSTIEQPGQAFSITTKDELSSWRELTFKLPFTVNKDHNFRWDFVKNEYYVRWVNGDNTEWYYISKPNGTKNSTVSMTVTCPHISTLLKTKNIYLEFDDENGIGTLPELVEKVLAGTGWTYDTTSDVFVEHDGLTEKIRSLKSNAKEGSYSLIQKLCTLFNAYAYFTCDDPYTAGHKNVKFYQLNHRDTEWEFVVGKDLDTLSVNYDSSSVVTRLYVEGEYGDFGYVGIDDVEDNPTGLNYILNFDYYKSIGLFTNAHQAILDQYVIDAKAKKTEISAAQSALNTITNTVVNEVGYVPFAIFSLKNGTGGKVIDQTWLIHDAEGDLATGDTLVGIKSRNEYTTFTYAGGAFNSDFIYIIHFENPALGQIGVDEASIEAKNQQITAWNKKISQLTSSISYSQDQDKQDKVAAYTDYIRNLNNEITTLYVGETATEENPDPRDGLYHRMYDLIENAQSMLTQQGVVETKTQELETIEVNFTAAMGDMLRDGRWSDENYTVGQEEELYADALDISARCAKPEVAYQIGAVSAKAYLGFGIEDIRLHTVGHIWDETLNVNDYGYIESVTICHDNEQNSKVTITTDDGYSKKVSLESVMTRIAQLADIVKQKNEMYERAGAIQSNGQISIDRLEGMIDVMKTKLTSTLSNWYTDDRGNLIFESVSGTGAMMLCGEGFLIASDKNPDGSWNWRTMGTGEGICADEISTGFLSAARIQAGSITADKIDNGYGAQIDLSDNAIMSRVQDAENAAETIVNQKYDEWSVELQSLYADKTATENAISDLTDDSETVKKFMTFSDDYLVIGSSANQFNVQITNTAINFRRGDQILAYMNNQKLYIMESEVTNNMRFGNYMWMLPDTSGSVAMIYAPVV